MYGILNADGSIAFWKDTPFPKSVELPFEITVVGGVAYWAGEAQKESVSEAQAAKRAEINAGFEAALTASLTMPSINPSAVEVAVGAAALAAVDADGPAYIMQTHTARRTSLLAAVDAATTIAEVQAITVSYAV